MKNISPPFFALAFLAIEVLLTSATCGQGLSILPSLFPDRTDVDSHVDAVSADGRTVVGHSSFSDGEDFYSQAFRWTREDALVGLASLPGRPYTEAHGVNGDGTIVVGGSGFGELSTYEAVRWTAGATTGLGAPTGALGSRALGLSTNGNVIYGGTYSAAADSGLVYASAMRWTEAGGFENLGYLSGWERESIISGSSAQGDVLAGYSRESQFNRTQAVRWSEATGMQGLGFLPGGNRSTAGAISGDGQTIVGSGNSDNAFFGSEAFRWTEEGGMLRLNDNPPLGGFISVASGITFDGSAIVGRARFGTENILEAFLWTESEGMRSLNSILDSDGVDRDGWFLTWATDISSDGTVIVGNASKTIGESTLRRGFMFDFRAVPEPASCTCLLSGILMAAAFYRPARKT